MAEFKAGKEFGEFMDTLAARIPGVLGAIREALFSEQAGRGMGKAVGAFYQELVAGGIPQDEAVMMAKQYTQGLQQAMLQFKGGPAGFGVGPDQCLGHGAGSRPASAPKDDSGESSGELDQE